MKITFVLSSLGIRGGHRVVYVYANRLQERGHEVAIVYPTIPPFPVKLLKQKQFTWEKATDEFEGILERCNKKGD